MRRRYVRDLGGLRQVGEMGGKAAHLLFLRAKGYTIPATYVCTTRAYHDHLRGAPDLLFRLRAELEDVLDPHLSYAVRSSATLEDSRSLSFAGQFETLLALRGVDAVLAAIERVWDSVASVSAQAYQMGRQRAASPLSMAVIVQAMVEPEVAGVSFSCNPITGMDEVVVEAVRGSGAALVQEGATPERWVNKWGGWLQRPAQAIFPETLIRQIVGDTRQIARAFGAPVDLEWVFDGRTLYWVQLRPITALEGVNIYSSRVAKEMLPGVIKPLVWSINVPVFADILARLLGEMIGPGRIDAAKIIKPFCYRAYMNMTLLGETLHLLGLPRNSFELMLGIEHEGGEKPRFAPSARTWLLLPKMVRFAARRWREASQLRKTIPSLRARYEALIGSRDERQDERGALERIETLRALFAEIAYFTQVTQVFMHLHFGMLKAQLKRLGLTLEEFDLGGDASEPDPYDLNARLEELHRQLRGLDDGARAEASHGNYLALLHWRGAEAFHGKLIEFMRVFGHLSDSSNDLSAVPWRERPDALLAMVSSYEPHPTSTQGKRSLGDLPLGPVRRQTLHWMRDHARTFGHHRDDISHLFTACIGELRNRFLALANILSQRGVLDAPDDVFYLYLDELRGIVNGDKRPGDVTELARRRRREVEEMRDISLPDVICGEQPPPPQAASGDCLTGTPTSSGYYQGRVCVVRGMHDFHKVRAGAVLVIPHSDVAWTPLFARVGAVVAESGGMLSHSSIVAREYRIPAVVSVEGACQLTDDSLVTVDGYHGEVIVNSLENE